jgi:protein-S-isoprenylcysteine O-methyltransferase Ste14
MNVVQLAAAYLILLNFFMLEFLLRKGKISKNTSESPADKKSTYFIGLTLFSVLILSLVFNLLSIGTFKNEIVSVIGLCLMCTGLFIRIWSMQILKKYYTRTLITTAEQEIIKKGPYKIIRHPGYLGTMLVWCAAGLAMQNYVIAIAATAMMITAYTYRIKNEEKMLGDVFGAKFNEYRKRTWKILPLLW